MANSNPSFKGSWKIWDASQAPGYHNDVVGIGQDDLTGLLQKQSHSGGDSARIYLPGLAISNSLNTASFNNDISYVLTGHDRGRLCAGPLSFQELPTGLPNCTLFSRLEREWKVTKTNLDQVFSMEPFLSGTF